MTGNISQNLPPCVAFGGESDEVDGVGSFIEFADRGKDRLQEFIRKIVISFSLYTIMEPPIADPPTQQGPHKRTLHTKRSFGKYPKIVDSPAYDALVEFPFISISKRPMT